MATQNGDPFIVLDAEGGLVHDAFSEDGVCWLLIDADNLSPENYAEAARTYLEQLREILDPGPFRRKIRHMITKHAPPDTIQPIRQGAT